MRRSVGFRAIPAAALLAWAAPTAAGTIDREFHESFDATAATTLELRHDDGDVVVEVWDRPTIDVHVRYLAEATRVGFGRERDFTVEFERRGDDVVVSGRETGGGISFGFDSLRVETYRFTVRVPAGVALSLSGDDGDVSVAGLRDRVTIRLDDGDVTLRDVRGPAVDVDAQDGTIELTDVDAEVDVRVDDADVIVRDSRIGSARFRLEDGLLRLTDCTGDAEIQADDADLVLERFAAARLVVRAEDGEIVVGLRPAPGFDGEIRADDGDVTIRLDAGASLDFDLAALDGRVDADVPAATVGPRRDRASGRLGAGDGRLVVRTNDGDVALHVSGGD